MGRTDEIDAQLDQLREEHDRLRAYAHSLEREMTRRDAWLINSIWEVARTANMSLIGVCIVAVLAMAKTNEWWQFLLAAMAFILFDKYFAKKMKSLEKSDCEMIGRDSEIDASL